MEMMTYLFFSFFFFFSRLFGFRLVAASQKGSFRHELKRNETLVLCLRVAQIRMV